MRSLALGLVTAVLSYAALAAPAAPLPGLRPPSVPLVVFDPYLSIWSPADKLTDADTQHWSHKPQPLSGLIRIDGETFRLVGASPAGTAALPQKSVVVHPTRTVCEFENGKVRVTLTFTTAALPQDIDALAQPLSYIDWTVRSVDGKSHDVSVLNGVSAFTVVFSHDQPVQWGAVAIPGLVGLRIGTESQKILQRQGDDTTIDWGYLYLVSGDKGATPAAGPRADVLSAFAQGRKLPLAPGEAAVAAENGEPTLALRLDFGSVGAAPVTRQTLVALDEIYAIRFFGDRLKPFWARDGKTAAGMLQAAVRNYPRLEAECEKFDAELVEDLRKAGGDKYAALGALVYRQALAGCGFAADANGQPLIFAKENSSNGCIATTDVFYPAAPLFLLMGPTYAKALVQPVMAYGSDEELFPYAFAPHDIGTYPRAVGQVYGVVPPDAKDFKGMMPVEESGNMILLVDAIAHLEGNADYASQYWPALTKWVDYLVAYGEDPAEQLCTDDFMGHLAHNANLSAKAIVGIAAYADLARRRGDDATARKFRAIADAYAKTWLARRDPGHSRNAFDRPGSWSQKYNLVWDKLLGLHVFPPSLYDQEIAWYVKQAGKYGVPLDSRTRRTKTDWSVWTATLARDPKDFRALVDPIFAYFDETTRRDAAADLYAVDRKDGTEFRARPVQGGMFIKLLDDPAVARKYAARDTFKAGGWAPLNANSPPASAGPPGPGK